MSTAVLAGMGMSLGIILFIRAIRPKVMEIGQIVEALNQRAVAVPIVSVGEQKTRISAKVAQLRMVSGLRASAYLQTSPLNRPGLRCDIAIMSKTWEELGSQMVVAAVGLGAIGPVVGLLLDSAGISIPLVFPVFLCVIMAVLGGGLPVLTLHNEAEAKRKVFRRATSIFLELVALAMAGALGVEGALQGASTVSGDPSFERIRAVLSGAHHRGEPPWDALAGLGVEIGIPELSELSANMALAGSEGAKVRETLSAKAKTMRRREMAEAEAEANSTTEKMFLPGILLLCGFMIFIGYPAIVHVFNGF
ncbi:MAG TPA: type II secretion system F family protein [Acidimicrobiales bacterium]|nr:type II secretion system F family protein [Acidimicrobiales bacterium]